MTTSGMRLLILLALTLPFSVTASGTGAPASDAPATDHQDEPPPPPSPAAQHSENSPPPAGLNGPGPGTWAWEQLKEATAREKAVWTRLRAAPDDEDNRNRAYAEFRDILTTYENIIRQSPNFAEAYAAAGLLLDRTGNREEALRMFLTANRLNPNIPTVKNQIGNYLAEDGSYRAALGYYLAAIDLAPDEPLYHYQLGSLLYAYRKFFIDDDMFEPATIDRKIHEAFRRAAELAPDNWPYLYRYGESFYDLPDPDWEAALAWWRSLAEKADPGLPRQTCLLHVANVLHHMGNDAEATRILEAITEPALSEEKQTLVDQLAQSRAE